MHNCSGPIRGTGARILAPEVSDLKLIHPRKSGSDLDGLKAKYANFSDDDLVDNLLKSTNNPIQVAGDGRIFKGNDRVQELMRRGINIADTIIPNLQGRHLYVPHKPWPDVLD